MIVIDVTWNVLAASGSALTPEQKWAAARGLNSQNATGASADYWFFVMAIAALVVLLGLLWQVSRRRRVPPRSLSRELFAENAMRRGLSARERQILLAVVMRSRLNRSHEIFTSAEAFDRGAAKLLAECLRTRTPDENEGLKVEVASLREKLGFQVLQNGTGPVYARSTSSRDIPADSVLELTRRRDRDGATIQARVVRNDDIELAVDLTEPVETHSSDAWRVRYSFGLSVWEFDTTAVGGDGKRLTLNHSDHVRFVNRRRFPRVAVNMPALIACFPFIHQETSDASEEPTLSAPVFVPGTVTELAGPGLRIETPLEVDAGDRVIVAFQVDPTVSGSDRVGSWDEDNCIIESLGLVRHLRSSDSVPSIAVELMGLSGPDVDTLVRITNRAKARVPQAEETQSASVPSGAMADASASVIGQEV